jgi:hypothetical protein
MSDGSDTDAMLKGMTELGGVGLLRGAVEDDGIDTVRILGERDQFPMEMNRMAVLEPTDYAATLEELERRVHQARYQAQRKVNTELIRLYWQIGHTILERQQTERWGTKVLSRLATDLRAEFPP